MVSKKILAASLLVSILFSVYTPRAVAATGCDAIEFISDLTIPDGTAFSPGTNFTKTWRLKNIGSCTWNSTYRLVYFGGDPMGAPLSIELPLEVVPNQQVDLSINLVAPNTAGHYRGHWKLSNASGNQFGIGSTASDAFWVDINVIETSAMVFNFVSSAPYAQWKSGAGPLHFSGASGDRRGYSYQLDRPHLEDDSVDSQPGLLTVPQNKYNGYIQATYPEFLVQKGDRLQTLVNCEFGATRCYVTFRIDYMMPNGYIGTLWKWNEAYEGRFHRADIDLSKLAGYKVKFILMTLGTGYASGDRAIWGSPRIIRTGSIEPPAPPATLTPMPPITPTVTPFGFPPPEINSSGCAKATFVTDVTVADGSYYSPGAVFSKTWRLKNSGWCTWTRDYGLMFYSGEQMSAPTLTKMPWSVYPGQTIDLTVNMIAPAQSGTYKGLWVLQNPVGGLFSVGSKSNSPFWVEINVAGDSPINSGGYDFFANACSAQWRSGAGPLPCPSADGSRSGFVVNLDSTQLEDGSVGTVPSLLVGPEYKYNGYIQGFYPTFTVQPGDRFRTTVGCVYGANCYVTFRLDYMTDTGWIGTLWTWREQNEKRVYAADIDLSPLAGRSVRFILTLLATGYASNDRALWTAPQIVHAVDMTPIQTPTSSPPPTPSISEWPTYTNQKYGFQFKYPKEGQVITDLDNTARITLPFLPGTNLGEKYLDVTVVENADPCRSPLASASIVNSAEPVTLNGILFLKETGGDAGAGQIYQWKAYSTLRDNACITLDFILHSTNPGNYATPPAVFNEAAEKVVFEEIMSTFVWLSQPSTETPTLTSTPTSTSTPAPTSTSTPILLQGPYAVTRVNMGEVLNIRENVGAGFPVVGTFAPDAIDVMRTGLTQQLDSSQWVEVLNPAGGTGWVNSYYLTEYVTHDAFCADERLLPMIGQLRQSMEQSNGDLFAPLVNPVGSGVNIHLWTYQAPVNFSQDAVRNIFTSTQSYNWGSGPRGEPDLGTFAEIIQPKLMDVLAAPDIEIYCDDLTKVYPLVYPWPQNYHGIHYYNLYKPATPGIDFDYRTWLIGFEYIEGEPYLFGMVNIVWEP